MIRAFLLTILLATSFAGLSFPRISGCLAHSVGGREALTAIATLVLLLALVMAFGC
jgi:hypothetical protein